MPFTVFLATSNRAVTYYEDLHKSVGKFDFVMANPPFNVDSVDKERLKDDPRYPFGLPKNDNANYLWIQIFYSSLNETGEPGSSWQILRVMHEVRSLRSARR